MKYIFILCCFWSLPCFSQSFEEQKLPFAFEGSDMESYQDALYIVGAKTEGLAPVVAKFDKKLNLLWQKTIAAPIGDCGLSQIVISPQGQIFVAGMSRSKGFVAEINSEGDTLWSQILGQYEQRGRQDSLFWYFQHLIDPKISALSLNKKGDLLLTGEASERFKGIAGFVQIIRPKTAYSKLQFFKSQQPDAWSGINNIVSIPNGYVLASEIGCTARKQQNCTLVFLDTLLQEQKRLSFLSQKRGEANVLLLKDEKIYVGASVDGNLLLSTDLKGDSICALQWGPDKQDDVYDLLPCSKGLLALHQWEKVNALSLFQHCSLEETLVLKCFTQKLEKIKKVCYFEPLGYVVLSHGSYLRETDNRVLKYNTLQIVQFAPKLTLQRCLLLSE